MRNSDSANPFALLTRALAFAAHKHRDQRRKDAGSSPYINHPIALAELLVHEGGIDDPTWSNTPRVWRADAHVTQCSKRVCSAPVASG